MNWQKTSGNKHFRHFLAKKTQKKTKEQCVFQGNLDENNLKQVGAANDLAKSII